jgi:CheY-like chemotaxis protein
VQPLILIVEDNPTSMRLMCVLMNLEKCPFLCAATVQEVRTCLAEARPTLVFMDIQVPGGSGEQLLRDIRAIDALAQTKVFALTALSMQGDRERLLAAGFDGYFSKPIDTHKIREVIRQHRAELSRTEPG